MNCQTSRKDVYFPGSATNHGADRDHPIDRLAQCEEGLERCRKNAWRSGWRKVGYFVGIIVGIMLLFVIATHFQF